MVPIPVGKPPYQLMRTPVEVLVREERDRTIYTVAIGHETYRRFDDTNVPSEITSVLGMIRAFPEQERMVTLSTWASRYVAPDPRLESIGWQISKDLFILLLPLPFLEHIYMTAEE